jgi:hypothetical protein
MFKTDSILGAGRRMALAVAAVGACVTFGTAAALAADQDFALINATGYAISELYVAPTKTSDWQEDVLGQDVLGDGQQVNVSFSRSSDTCHWDLKVVYADDNTSAEWLGVDLCALSAVTIEYNADSGETSAYGE